MQVANVKIRFMAYLIDQLITVCFFIPASFASLIAPNSEDIGIPLSLITLGFVLQFMYKWVFLKLFRATIGKMLFKLRVVNVNSFQEPLSWMQSLIRVIADHFAILLSLSPFGIALLNSNRRHFSDFFAETQVVQIDGIENKTVKIRWFIGPILIIYFAMSGLMFCKQMLAKGRIQGKYFYITK